MPQSIFWGEGGYAIAQMMTDSKTIIQQAFDKGHELAAPLKKSCDEAGLYEIDMLRLLCANLLNHYDQANTVMAQQNAAIDASKKLIEAMEGRKRQIVAVMPMMGEGPNRRVTAICNDGTTWQFFGSHGWGCISPEAIPQT